MELAKTLKVSIVKHQDDYSHYFKSLNVEWLEKYFVVEPYDNEVLSNPDKYILQPGGEILYALVNNEVVGTVALIKRGDDLFELSKMAVTEKYKGLRIGQKLMYACIHLAGEIGCNRLFLDSNRKLQPALTLYDKVGFKEIPTPKDTPYERCNIRMGLMI